MPEVYDDKQQRTCLRRRDMKQKRIFGDNYFNPSYGVLHSGVVCRYGGR